MLAHLFGSSTRARLLAFVFSHPDESYYTRELTRKIDAHLTAVRRELENLTTIGLLVEKGEGVKKFYKANPKFLLFDELKRLLFKAEVLVELDMVAKLSRRGNIFAIILTGFFVSDDNAATDVFIVGTINRRTLQTFMKQVQRQLDYPLRYTLMSRKEFMMRYDLGDRFLYDLLEGKSLPVYDRMKFFIR